MYTKKQDKRKFVFLLKQIGCKKHFYPKIQQFYHTIYVNQEERQNENERRLKNMKKIENGGWFFSA